MIIFEWIMSQENKLKKNVYWVLYFFTVYIFIFDILISYVRFFARNITKLSNIWKPLSIICFFIVPLGVEECSDIVIINRFCDFFALLYIVLILLLIISFIAWIKTKFENKQKLKNKNNEGKNMNDKNILWSINDSITEGVFGFISSILNIFAEKPEHLANEILRDIQIINPEELIALIKKQGNKVYYRQNNIYEYINIPIILRGKKDYKFDIIYYFLTNGSDNIKERISRMIGRSLGNTLCANVNYSDLRLLKKYFKEISGLDIKFVNEKTEVEREEKEYKKNKAENYYKLAKDDYEKGNYTSAEEYINLAIKLIPDNIKYSDLLNKITSINNNIESTEIKTERTDNNQKKNTNKKIKLESCTKDDLLSIDGFDEEKADRFIEERENDKMYYDIESFVADYNLMPHQMVEIQDRLIFPKKPKNKIGRKIEW